MIYKIAEKIAEDFKMNLEKNKACDMNNVDECCKANDECLKTDDETEVFDINLDDDTDETINEIINNLAEASAHLDNCGLSKQASSVLKLAVKLTVK
jgi:hypothetical protein